MKNIFAKQAVSKDKEKEKQIRNTKPKHCQIWR